MATFTAFNIEAEESDDEEIDNTKEIQIEDALKLYQTALKYQSQGPEYFPQAFQAYGTLLKSEIFKYPEALSDWQRTTSQVQDYDADDFINLADEEALVPPNGNDAAPSTVPQIVYLIYKNYGELILKDVLRSHQILESRSAAENETIQAKFVMRTYLKRALENFADALERDETDLELWRTTARLTGETFQSLRLLRFCLESVVDQDNDSSTSMFSRLNLDEKIAKKDLARVLNDLSDKLSLSQTPKSGEEKLKARFGAGNGSKRPFPSLPCPTTTPHPVRRICPKERTWASVGEALLQALVDVDLGFVEFAPGSGFNIALPLPTQQNIPYHSRLPPVSTTTAGRGMHPNAVRAPLDGQSGGQVVSVSHTQIPPPLETSQSAISDTQGSQVNGNYGPTVASPETNFPAPQSAQTEGSTVILPSRKRSSASAGNDETVDGGRGRSKRIRARESNAEPLDQDEDNGSNSTIGRHTGDLTFLKRFRLFLDADKYMINLMREIYLKLDMDQGRPIEDIQELANLIHFRNTILRYPYTEDERIVMCDMASVGTNWTNEKAQAFMKDNANTPNDASATSLDVFLEHLRNPGQSIMNRPTLSGDEGLSNFITLLGEDGEGPWLGIHQICFRWLAMLLLPDYPQDHHQSLDSKYVRWLWPKDLKKSVAQMIVAEDEHVFGAIMERATCMESRILNSAEKGEKYSLSHQDLGLVEMAQALYELHLDIYAVITSPSSSIEEELRIAQKDRLSRWGDLAYGLISHRRNSTEPEQNIEHLTIRHLWAAALHVKVTEDASREHILLCLEDLRKTLVDANNPVILLPNNAVMPEISVIAIDQELSKLNTMDYFLKIFNADESECFLVIESLEPVLLAASDAGQSSDQHLPEEVVGTVGNATRNISSPVVREMIKLLDRGSTSLKLFLWRRLRSAYDSIGYKSKAVCCYLRCIELIIRDMVADKSDSTSEHERHISLLKSVRSLDDLLTEVVDHVMEDPQSLEEVDFDLGKSSLTSLAALVRVLYGYHLTDDYRSSVGPLPNEELTAPVFLETANNIRIRAFTLQYILLKDCMLQTQENFPNLSELLAEYLSSIHFGLGLRSQCKDASKLILRFALKEFVSLGVTLQYRFDLAQVLFDLYGWKLAPEVQIHECPSSQLDRPTALMLINFVLSESRRYNIKDLIKSDLRSMIDKMQQLIGGPEPSTAFTMNRRLLNAFLKSPINPVDLYRYIKGIGELSMAPVHTHSATAAEKGWYFLLGYIALSKFKSQQRFSPSTTDDLDIAIAFFKQDLEHDAEKWETWYRLAQTFDAKLYEGLQWDADQINNQRPALAILQRQAIHCYGMAAAAATRDEDAMPATLDSKAQLFTDFGMRIYASSREPLSMEAFSLGDFSRHISKEGQPLHTATPFDSMKTYSAWKLASALFKGANQLKPGRWTNYYHLGKCLWKMLTRPDPLTMGDRRVRVDEVINALVKAIENLPECRDSRQDPILEPHYKLVSIVHKLVYQGRIAPGEGSQYLQATRFARDLPRCDEVDNWEPLILKIIERLSKEDKSNWHHRISARAAHVIYDSSKEFHAAMGARHQFSQQIFTKTMVLQVWKPENETIGRHFVYTTRYVQFFMTLLIQLNDRGSIDALVRRVRKKPAGYFGFPALWEEICTAYLNLIRRQCNIPTGHDEVVFANTSYDEFSMYANRIQDWIHSHRENRDVFPMNDLIVSVNELKVRVNSGLMKPNLFDDLIADTYALLYEKFLPAVRAQIDGEGNRERMSINHLTTFDGVADAPPLTHPPSPFGAPLGPLPFEPGSIPRPRPPRGVIKRDLLRRAESLVLKPPPSATGPSLLPRPNVEPSGAQLPGPPLPIREDLLRAENVDSAGGSSVPGSVHDSADDESELSEVDESRIAKPPLFPGLVGAILRDDSAMETEEEVGDGDDEGEGEGEVEGDGDVEGEVGEEETAIEEGKAVEDETKAKTVE